VPNVANATSPEPLERAQTFNTATSVLHPALARHPRNEIEKRDFLGACGLFSIKHGRLQQGPRVKRRELVIIAFFVTYSTR
jgi:cystathionine beta-lyase/cystathionine gamma-synthase